VIGFNVVYQQFRAMCDSGCQICCNWSRFRPGFKMPAHRSWWRYADVGLLLCKWVRVM